VRKCHSDILSEQGNDSSRATSQSYVKPPTDGGKQDPPAATSADADADADADTEMTDAGDLTSIGSASGSTTQKPLTFVFSDGTE
jgi:hypothetical protein